uniref:Uncharacterized protein n=1 Tax=Plectus sambesii TaxID=2011161 RepID=A0A914VGP1_9BILA
MASYYRRNRGASSRFPRRTQYSNQRIYPKSTDIDAPPNVPPAIESFPWTDIINKEIPLFELRNRDLQISDERVKDEDLVGMKNFRRIATYNWMTSDSVHPTGTMVIPGVPRIYDSTVSKKIIKLKPDKWFVAYPDGYHSPDYPMEPVFRAIEECKPSDFNFQDHHILTDSACLKHFLCFGNEKLEPEEPPVRIDVERIGDLVVLSRQEKSPVYRFESSSAYGIDFKDCVTIDTDKDAPTNDNFHQVITYQFGQFNMIVSSKVDCCKTLEMKQDDKDGDTVDKLVKTLATGLDLNRDSYGKESKLSVIKYGSLRQFDMVELLTRKEGRELRWDKVWQRVFFTGAKHLV